MTPAMMLRNTSASVLIGAIHTSDGMANVASFFEAGVDVVNFAALLSYDSSNINKVLIGGTRQTNWFNEHDLAGSALRYLPSDYDQELGNKLFAVDVFPEGYCSDPDYSSQWCIEYSRLALNPVISKLKDTPAYIYPALGERIYSVAATDTGPSQFETLPIRSTSGSISRAHVHSSLMGYDADQACWATPSLVTRRALLVASIFGKTLLMAISWTLCWSALTPIMGVHRSTVRMMN